jgi:hypothetical protein
VRLVEDVFVVLLRNFKLRDFISLMSTCKLFYYYRLAPNNYFWAQFCAQVAGSINQLLLSVQQGRRFVMNGKVIDLNAPILPTDKTMIGQFDFRSELERYYIFIVNYQRVLSLFSLKPPWAFVHFPTCTINLASVMWPQQWANPNKTRQHYTQDYYYLVDFMGSPTALSPTLQNPVLRDHIGGRQIVYNNSIHPPPIFNPRQLPPFSRTIQARSMLPRPAPPPSAPKKFNFKPWHGRYHPYPKKDGKQ